MHRPWAYNTYSTVLMIEYSLPVYNITNNAITFDYNYVNMLHSTTTQLQLHWESSIMALPTEAGFEDTTSLSRDLVSNPAHSISSWIGSSQGLPHNGSQHTTATPSLRFTTIYGIVNLGQSGKEGHHAQHGQSQTVYSDWLEKLL